VEFQNFQVLLSSMHQPVDTNIRFNVEKVSSPHTL
jgi:hypothetical protein